MKSSRSHRSRPKMRRIFRHGAVAVEFAIVAPLLLTIVLAMIELGRSFEVQQVMKSAAREGARLGAMDRDGMLLDGQTSNQKIESDIRAFLTAAGVDGNAVNITITPIDNSDSTFSFDAPENRYQLFRIRLEIPYALVSLMPAKYLYDKPIVAEVVFRNAKTTIVG